MVTWACPSFEQYHKIKGMTELAEAVNASLSTVQRWEAGGESRVRALVRLAQVLDGEPGKLLDEIVA